MLNDLISRQMAIALADSLKDELPDDERVADLVIAHNEGILEYQIALRQLPCAQRYTDEELQKIQEMEQAEIQRAFQLGREDALAEGRKG